MKPSNDLFRLIKSLTRSEKRYFIRFCKLYSSKKENNYIKLFYVIEKQMFYDEKRIKDKFKNEKFVKQLNVIKNYLFHLILKSLRLYNEKNSDGIMLRESAIEIDLLAKKRLFDQSYKLLRGNKKLALLQQDPILQLELFRIEKSLLHSYPIGRSIERIGKLAEKEKTLLKEISEYNNNLLVEAKLDKIVEETGTLNEKHYVSSYYKETAKIIKQLKKPSETGLNLTLLNFVFLRTLIKYYEFVGDVKAAMNYTEELIRLFDLNKYFLQFNILHYCGVLYDHFWLLIRSRQFTKAKAIISKLIELLNKKTIFSTISFHSKLYLAICELQLFLNNSLGLTQVKYKSLNDLETFLINIEDIKDSARVKTVYLYISINYLIAGNFSKALEWLNRMQNEIHDNIAISTGILSKVVLCILHYELKNYQFLENAFRSSSKFFSKVNYKNSIEHHIIKTVFEASNAPGEKEKKELFSELRKRVSNDNKGNANSGNLKVFDTLAWLDSKIMNKSLLKIVREKAFKLH